MLEIFLIWRLAKYIGNEATKKGLKKGRYQLMAVLLWIFGEWSGAVLGVTIFDPDVSVWPSYGIAVLGGIFGAVVTFLVMRYLPNPIPSNDQSMTVIEEAPLISPDFARSVWLPILVIVLAVCCFYAVLGGIVVIQM